MLEHLLLHHDPRLRHERGRLEAGDGAIEDEPTPLAVQHIDLRVLRVVARPRDDVFTDPAAATATAPSTATELVAACNGTGGASMSIAAASSTSRSGSRNPRVAGITAMTSSATAIVAPATT